MSNPAATLRFRTSAVIPTFQRRDSLRRLLEALSSQTLPPDDFEVIVCIDGSTDGTREMVEGFGSAYSLRSIWQPNRGRAAACNAGIRVAHGELLVLLDDDMEPIPTCLAAHVEAHIDGARQGVSGAVPVPLGSQSSAVVAYIGRRFNRHLARISELGYELTPRDVPTANFSIQREVLLEIGGFDERFQMYGNEDVDLSVRLIEDGVRLVYNPDALAYQQYTKDLKGLVRDTIAKGRTSVTLARKHPEMLADLRLSKYHDGSVLWRLLRGVLLTLTARWEQTGALVVTGLDLLGSLWSTEMGRYYDLALDYFYWVGVMSALQAERAASKTST